MQSVVPIGLYIVHDRESTSQLHDNVTEARRGRGRCSSIRGRQTATFSISLACTVQTNLTDTEFCLFFNDIGTK